MDNPTFLNDTIIVVTRFPVDKGGIGLPVSIPINPLTGASQEGINIQNDGTTKGNLKTSVEKQEHPKEGIPAVLDLHVAGCSGCWTLTFFLAIYGKNNA